MGWFSKKPKVSKPTLVAQKPQGTLKFSQVKRAYEACLQFGGRPVMGFGQGQWLVREAWKPYYTGTGICQALVNYWIADHAADSSLWARLFSSAGVFQPANIVEIAQQQGLFGKADEHGTNTKVLQKLRSENFLKSKGLLRRNDIVSGQAILTTGGERNGTNDPTRGWRIGQEIAYKGMKNAYLGCYRMISLTSDTISHVTCAWVGQDVAFFDPNYGEFYFEDKDDFVQWMSVFWMTDTYNNFDGIEIRDYAQNAMTAARRG